jgi:Cu2+-exporting ATPase
MAGTRDLDSFVRPVGDDAVAMELAVEGVHCGACIRRVEQGLKKLDGIVEARVNFTNRRLSVMWRKDRIEPAAIVDELARIGYPAQPFQPRVTEEADAAESKRLLTAIGVSGFAAMNIMLLSVSVWAGNASDITPWQRDFFHWVSAVIAIPAAAYAGQTFFKSAFKALRGGGVNMDVPISLGVILALGLSVVETVNHEAHAYFDSAVMLLFFLLCGRYFDHAMRQRTRAVAGNLAALKVEFANRMMDGGAIVLTPVSALQAGDRVLVRPGERIPADGIIGGGASQIDESFVTGETMRRAVMAGDTVYAGTMNYGGALEVGVTAAGEGTLIDEIERLLEKAVLAKSRYVRLADRAAGYYAPVVHTAALATLIGWLIAGASFHQSIVTAISVLIITCPCALALAVPVVQVVAAGALFRRGIFLNAGDAIERIAEANIVVFDKTGTLTLPEPRIVNAHEIDPGLLRVASRLAKSSTHPLAAVVAPADVEGPVSGAAEDMGQGVRAVIDGVEARFGSPAFCDVTEAGTDGDDVTASRIAVRYGDRSAVLVIRQTLRNDAVTVMRALRHLGLELMIVSGDRAAAVAPIAQALGIERWKAEVKPADKVATLEALRAEGRRVLMVGDGLNDSPALATAHVSLAPIDAADLSKAHADAVFLGDRLGPVADAIVVARRARALMRQNLMLAVVYNAIAVPVAIAGYVTPLIAAVAMSGSSILVTLNAFRLHYGLRRALPDDAVVPAVAAPVKEAAWTS